MDITLNQAIISVFITMLIFAGLFLKSNINFPGYTIFILVILFYAGIIIHLLKLKREE